MTSRWFWSSNTAIYQTGGHQIIVKKKKKENIAYINEGVTNTSVCYLGGHGTTFIAATKSRVSVSCSKSSIGELLLSDCRRTTPEGVVSRSTSQTV